MFDKVFYAPQNSFAWCPAVVVGVEADNAIIWKIVNGVVLERCVPFFTLVKVKEGDEELWIKLQN